ncbi:MAG: hypothetical protein COB66_01725 [Coxiella sp. (in: Bacteria)]|nr:MAG: hypothetical protein COB66_01725 [Coxiella sp. (in: g-proteobacteria)]
MLENWRNDNRIPLGLMALMALLLVIYLYDLTGDFRSTSSSVSTSASGHVTSIQNISQWHVFGTYDDNMQNLPATQLQLVLEGVMLSPNNPQQSYAIISSPSTPAKVYKIGDQIPGGAKLKAIQRQEVVLRYQGQLQSLKLPVEQLTFSN